MATVRPLSCEEVVQLIGWYLADDFQMFREEHPEFSSDADVREAFVGHVRACNGCHDKYQAMDMFLRLGAPSA